MKVGKSVSGVKGDNFSYLAYLELESLIEASQPWGMRWSLSNRMHDFRRSIKEKTRAKLWK
jgi:hypothetical protein